MPADLMMPMIPAVAMPPMPMCLAYVVKISSGDIEPTVAVIPVCIKSKTSGPHIRFIKGMMTSHTKNEPQHITKEYLRPII